MLRDCDMLQPLILSNERGPSVLRNGGEVGVDPCCQPIRGSDLGAHLVGELARSVDLIAAGVADYQMSCNCGASARRKVVADERGERIRAGMFSPPALQRFRPAFRARRRCSSVTI